MAAETKICEMKFTAYKRPPFDPIIKPIDCLADSGRNEDGTKKKRPARETKENQTPAWDVDEIIRRKNATGRQNAKLSLNFIVQDIVMESLATPVPAGLTVSRGL